MPSPNDIAIIGMALRVPGAATPEQFWQNLRDGREALQAYSPEQLLARGVPRADLADPRYVRAGMPLEGFDQFDPEFFGFSPKEAAILDPQHRQFYEVAWEALERAGCVPGRFEGAIGVFAGCGMGAYFAQNLLRNADLVRSVGLFLLRHTGNDKDFLATRVSYAFDLKGPSVGVQTACSTSLVATHLAVQSLLARETDVALAGGVTIELPHGVGYRFQEGEILSPDGHCRAFDHRSRGTVFGSGAAVVALKRLDDALRDGDHVHAVIKATAINNDGATKVGYLAPSVEGQAAAIAEALALAGVDGDAIGYVECHGTGTPMGDPIEVEALTQAFRETSTGVGHCLIGSVKSNIGHLDTAAGVAGLIKAALALEHGAIPPSLNFEAPNPAIAFAGSPFRVASTLMPWPRGAQPRRAGVNSLGVGGTNAFAVLEEAPSRAEAAAREDAHALAFSALGRKALDDYGARLAAWLRANPDADLGRVAASLALGRRAFPQRRVLAARNAVEAAALLESGDARRVFTLAPDAERPSVVFMFPGGGAQYTGMARGLYAREPAFRDVMERGFAILQSRHGVDLRGVFLADPAAPALEERLARPSVQLPLVFLIEQALVALWAAYGVRPAALIGHSMGENAAACAAGVFSLEEGLALVLLRGQLMDDVPDGGMLSVPMPAGELAALLGPDLDLAAANRPTLSIASGPRPALQELADRLAARGIESRRVRIDIAAHSRMLDGILDRFRDCLRGMRLRAPSLPIVSNLTGTWLTAAEATDPEYWVAHLRNTVRFSDGARQLLEAPDRVFLEVGPGGILGGFVRQLEGAPLQRIVASLRHPDDAVDDDLHFRTVLGRLWAMGVAVDAARTWPGRARGHVPLPTYAFQHSRYWIDPSASADAGGDEDALLPERIADVARWFATPRWMQQGIAITAEDDAPRSWCVFHDADPLAEACVRALRAAGHRVVEVQAADTFARVTDDLYTLSPESGGAPYGQLLDALAATDRLPDRILHTWLLTRRESFRPGTTFLHRNQCFGFYSLFYLARAFARRAEGRRSHWIVAANGAASVDGEPQPFPEKATAMGACAVIPRELPGVTCAFVDVQVGNGADDAAADALREELAGPAQDAVVAWRGRVRWTRQLAPLRAAAPDAELLLRDRGTYLVTGGFGGVAGIVAEWLAREYRARIVLLSRTPLPPREDWPQWLAGSAQDDAMVEAINRVVDLERIGAEVLPLAADVTVAEQVDEAAAAIRERFGRLDGIFHAAGVLRDGLIAAKSERDVEEVLAAKLYGTLVLDRVFRDWPLDFVLLFASTSAFVAPAGQVDYVAANAFLNAFAESCRGTRRWPVRAVDWGIWKGIGMVAGVPGALAADTPVSADAGPPAVPHPFLASHAPVGEGSVRVHEFTGRIPQGHWIADDHRLASGAALLPATGYLELLRAVLAGVGEPGPWSATSVAFLAPFYVDDAQGRAFRIRLRGLPGRWRAEVRVPAGDDDGTGGWQVVATARLLTAGDRPAAVDIAAIEARCTRAVESAAGLAWLRTRQEAHLRFGPRWRVLRSLRLGDGEALARLELPQPLHADLDWCGVHPGLLDIATGCAMDLIAGYAAHETPANLWVPVGYGAFSSYGPMPPAFTSWIRVAPGSAVTAGFAAFDVLLVDDAGTPFARLDRLTLRRLDGELPRPGASAGQARNEDPGVRALAHNAAGGVVEAEGIAVLRRMLSADVPPVVVASPFRVADLLAQADAIARLRQRVDDARFARPELATNFEAPRDEVERTLAETWGRLLGVEGIGIRDSFFELGGHSLVAVRLFKEVSERFGVDLPMSVLMQHPDVASLAERIRGGPPGTTATTADGDAPVREADAFRYLVPMHAGTTGTGTPLFVVAGMFGNVLNLSHLAHLTGEDRPFLALQARGLYGEAPPHETFEEMAAEYLAEVRRFQPQGPYLLGGFSGGGLIAFEMARQLLAAGERVSALVLLDTPVRKPTHLSLYDRLQMSLPGLRAEGPAFLLRKLRERRAWRHEQAEHDAAREREARDALRFHSQQVGEAFLRALARFQVPSLPLDALLFRPKLRPAYRLRDGRMLDAGRHLMQPDNGWTGRVASLTVVEVPGNHDSMVLEPNVRVLAGRLRAALRDADLKPPC